MFDRLYPAWIKEPVLPEDPDPEKKRILLLMAVRIKNIFLAILLAQPVVYNNKNNGSYLRSFLELCP